MIQIAICDDERESVALHEKNRKDKPAEAWHRIRDHNLHPRAANLLYDITDDHFFYDLLLLDIEMPGFTGMELPEKIKPFLPNVKIIFITSHLEYAIDAYELSIFRYVPKDHPERRLSAAVADAAKLIELEAGQEYIIQTSHRMEKYHIKAFSISSVTAGKIR